MPSWRHGATSAPAPSPRSPASPRPGPRVTAGTRASRTGTACPAAAGRTAGRPRCAACPTVARASSCSTPAARSPGTRCSTSRHPTEVPTCAPCRRGTAGACWCCGSASGAASDPEARRRYSQLRCFAFPRWHPRGTVVERFHRILLARDRERGQLLLGLEPVLHVAPLRAAGFLPQLAGTLRDALLQLLVVHVAVSPLDGPAQGPRPRRATPALRAHIGVVAWIS